MNELQTATLNDSSGLYSHLLQSSPYQMPTRIGRIKRRSYPTTVVRKQSSELLLHAGPDTVMTRYFPPLESVTNPLEIVERLKREPELGFLYLTPAVARQSVKYNPYNLRWV